MSVDRVVWVTLLRVLSTWFLSNLLQHKTLLRISKLNKKSIEFRSLTLYYPDIEFL